MANKRAIFTSLFVILLVSLATFGFILYGKGYRLNLSGKGNKIIAGTGLLVLTSTPNGGKVYLNDNLTTATDDTINLPPGDYDVRIEKDGYYPWKKHVILKKEAVTKTDAVLFPSTPKLEAATLLGAVDPIVDPTGNLIAYKVASSSAINNGIYILNIGNRSIITFGSPSKEIASDQIDLFSQGKMEFSPDGQELLVTIPAPTENRVYLLRTDMLNTTPQNITFTVEQTRAQWAIEKQQLDEKFDATLPSKSRAFMLKNFVNIKASPEGDKILYTASESATIPTFITPPLPSTNSTPETRKITKGSVYVYQVKEDKNYLLYTPVDNEPVPDFVWYPTSAHLVFVEQKRIFAIEYDGQNKTTLYTGPFNPSFLYTWPDGSGLIILTNFNDEAVPANLYKVGLK